jgi:hypothetical protein
MDAGRRLEPTTLATTGQSVVWRNGTRTMKLRVRGHYTGPQAITAGALSCKREIADIRSQLKPSRTANKILGERPIPVPQRVVETE